jgi:hypothetical protein
LLQTLDTFRHYKDDFQTKLRLQVLNAAFKVVTGNPWLAQREMEKRIARILSGEESPRPQFENFEHVYVTRDGLDDLVERLAENMQSIQIDLVPSVVSATTLVPNDLVPSEDFFAFDLGPRTGFFDEEILPCLLQVISAYRIAVFPWMRYSISPVSEALVDQAYVEILNGDERSVGSYFYGFDSRSMSHLERMKVPDEIQRRFDRVVSELDSHQAEDQMAGVYYLYHMRRWTEALVIASAVVENLQRQLVYKLASTEFEAEAICKAYGYQDIFNKVLPEFGIPKFFAIDKEHKELWDDFVEAKRDRGSKAHGGFAEPFDVGQERQVKRHLATFYEIAKWLTQQLGDSWALDAFDEGKRLNPFP